VARKTQSPPLNAASEMASVRYRFVDHDFGGLCTDGLAGIYIAARKRRHFGLAEMIERQPLDL